MDTQLALKTLLSPQVCLLSLENTFLNELRVLQKGHILDPAGPFVIKCVISLLGVH